MINTHRLPQHPGVAKRHECWDEITQISTIGRASLQTIPNYRLIKAATRAQASPQARLLLVHLIGYLGMDSRENPKTRFIVFPGNERLADELNYSKRSIQRLADELEAKGLLRRCYNGVNRRTGFDLTPLAMQHEEIEASIVAIQTQRKINRDRQQMELSLSADQIERPIRATTLASRDVGSVTHNRLNDQDSAAAPILEILSTVPESAKLNCLDGGDALKDRTGDTEGSSEALVLRHLTGTGRASHLGWAQAKRSFGFEGALSLITIAEGDPQRRATTDRYFGWLLRMALSGDGQKIIAEAAARVANKFTPAANATTPRQSTRNQVPDQDNSLIGSVDAEGGLLQTVAPGEAKDMGIWRTAIRDELGHGVYDRWFHQVRLSQAGSEITITARSRFAATYIEDNFGRMVQFAIQSAANSQDLKVIFRVA